MAAVLRPHFQRLKPYYVHSSEALEVSIFIHLGILLIEQDISNTTS
jgi:hypothetical protein